MNEKLTIKVTISREIAWTAKSTVVDILAENTRLVPWKSIEKH